MRIALAGNPNSGKTTMYNALTGSSEKVGNWAGVTVEKKESPIRKSLYEYGDDIIAVDLPGAYSMSPFTSETLGAYSYSKGSSGNYASGSGNGGTSWKDVYASRLHRYRRARIL